MAHPFQSQTLRDHTPQLRLLINHFDFLATPIQKSRIDFTQDLELNVKPDRRETQMIATLALQPPSVASCN